MSDEHLAREHGFQFVLQGADAANPVPLGIPLSALRGRIRQPVPALGVPSGRSYLHSPYSLSFRPCLGACHAYRHWTNFDEEGAGQGVVSPSGLRPGRECLEALANLHCSRRIQLVYVHVLEL